ncbi:anhydro-N-acetylmuramic acid kinase [Dokdonia sp. Hel_I_53]|uniref:anhydro-N-acetylmuramic acid kinase n=1 Tax=Dokdonia sp. Hel_I_53 TaxID=1566287 RepID=UPI00119AFD06|nr:anhydro-N-acetylmuramic acid kinase [Dokdonia sp. Hel_I_53]TVZ53118.1 anhydro-N-acetylmuramic acid kinase [Dokdonia sp. Hel_I_53]
MEQNSYNVIGVMSGTSLDGIDCAYVQILKKPQYSALIDKAQTYPYTQQWKDKLSAAHTLSKEDLTHLNEEYTRYLGEVINTFIEEFKIEHIDIISSHGHTILHQPERGYTLQIGNLQQLAALTSQKVVCDFRVQDVVLGGQGAPLVPIGDELLFSHYDYCLNLGGFANVSTKRKDIRIAYDICPVNVVLNKYAQKLDAEYDDNGAFAKAGVVQNQLLEKLNSLAFYNSAPPKSLGIEWVHQYVFPLLDATDLTPKDFLATFTEHIAIQLANQFEKNSSVFVTGGGAYNSFLLERLSFHKDVTLIVPDASMLEFKEALIFALLGVLRLDNKVNILSSVTGASLDHCSGVIYN